MKHLKQTTTIIIIVVATFILGGIFVSTVSAVPNLAKKLAGRFLLAVEDKGKIWYVDPVSLKRESVAGPKGCWELAKKKAMGIRNKDLGGIGEGESVYKNDEIGISFRYPSSWGEVKFYIENGDTGKKFYGSFKNNDILSFGGVTPDYTAGRGGIFTDNWGYLFQDGKYFAKFVSDILIEISKDTYSLIKEIDTQSGKALILRGKGRQMDLGENELGVIINLKNSEFPGIAFQGNASKLTLNQLVNIIQTITIEDGVARVKVYFLPKQYYSTDCSITSEVIKTIPYTKAVATAAINELLKGIEGSWKAIVETSIPTGTKLLSLKIENGVAYPDFSKEFQNYGGGSCNVQAIRAQIEATLKQFPNVKKVIISVEGQTENVLQP